MRCKLTPRVVNLPLKFFLIFNAASPGFLIKKFTSRPRCGIGGKPVFPRLAIRCIDVCQSIVQR